MKKILSVLICCFLVIGVFIGCSKKVDYPDVTVFETELNKGEDLTGKTVTFEVNGVRPASAFGYDLFGGEHLNFVSAKNPGAKYGDIVTVKVTDITSMLGSWIIEYDLISIDKGPHSGEEEPTEPEDISESDEVEITDSTNGTETTEPIDETTISELNVDYPNAEDFEAKLNKGDDLIGKTVTFEVVGFDPDSSFGYNLWGGEHLNFVSPKNPGAKYGDIVTVKVTDITSMAGSWIIEYKMINIVSGPNSGD